MFEQKTLFVSSNCKAKHGPAKPFITLSQGNIAQFCNVQCIYCALFTQSLRSYYAVVMQSLRNHSLSAQYRAISYARLYRVRNKRRNRTSEEQKINERNIKYTTRICELTSSLGLYCLFFCHRLALLWSRWVQLRSNPHSSLPVARNYRLHQVYSQSSGDILEKYAILEPFVGLRMSGMELSNLLIA